MIAVAGGDLVLPDQIVTGGTLLVEGGRIAAVERRSAPDAAHRGTVRADECYVVPGFVDVHVHGVEGIDTLDGTGAVAAIAERLPRYGVTSFCPTTVACPPDVLKTFLDEVAAARRARTGARVLPAHLESNFIAPEYAGAQPVDCLRLPAAADVRGGEFSGREILDLIGRSRADVGIVTLAPELPGAMELIRSLATDGVRVSLGHSGADVDTALAAIDAGARHATHLFNRMPPLGHRTPGLAGAVLSSDGIAAELICDGYHVHAAAARMAVRAKGPDRIMAITDGTAGSGMAPGSRARLGGRRILVRPEAAFLEDGTLAGSTLTMDRALRTLVVTFGQSIVAAATMCATTPARELGLTGVGVLAEGAVADFVILDRGFRVVRTFIDGAEAWSAATGGQTPVTPRPGV